jgi:hypothetical protein
MPLVRLRAQSRVPHPVVHRKPLHLEQLEDRSVPATFNVTTTLNVIDPNDGKRSLREAITQANTLAGADVIVLPAGTYKITPQGGSGIVINDTVTVRGAG